jgi:hypothetical protein
VGFCERCNAASLPRQPVSHSILEAESPILPGTDTEDHRSFGLMTPGTAGGHGHCAGTQFTGESSKRTECKRTELTAFSARDILRRPGPSQFVWGAHGMVDQAAANGPALWELG